MPVTGPTQPAGCNGSGLAEAATPGYALFDQPWWLDAVAPGAWRALEVRRGGVLAARWAVTERRRGRRRMVGQPPFTPFLGPWTRPSNAKFAEAQSDAIELLEELLRQLPPAASVRVHAHPRLVTGLPFHWHGFQLHARYSYRVAPAGDPERLWQETRQHIRTDIRKARQTLQVRTDLPLAGLRTLIEQTFRRQGRTAPLPWPVLEALDEACQRRGARTLYCAQDARGQVHAAAYVVSDQQAAYYLLGGGNPELRNSGASSLLLWEALQQAAAAGRDFDFEGSMMRPLEHFFRGFGGRPCTYLGLYRESLSLQLLRASWAKWRSWRRA
jgi:hypothetical protein